MGMVVSASIFLGPLASKIQCCSRCKSKCQCSSCRTLKPDKVENGNSNEQTNDNEDWHENLTVDDLFG